MHPADATGATYPVAQPEQAPLPVPLAYVLVPHETHAVSPVLAAIFPAGQAVQLSAVLSGLKYPVLQEMQDEAPAPLYFPALQSKHESLPVPL